MLKFGEMSMAPFVDTASRGSQTDETTLGNANYRSYIPSGSIPTPGQSDNSPTAATFQTAKKRPLPTPSRIAPLALIPNNEGKGPKDRRITPHTNRSVGTLPPQLSATEFDLAGLAFGPIPMPSTDYSVYNDDLIIEHYIPSPHCYAGGHRKGIPEPFPNALSHEQHVEAALDASSPLHDPAPLPRGLELALRFNRDNDLETARAFRNKQPNYLRILADESRSETRRLYSAIPPTILPATGKVHIALSAHLLDYAGVGGTKWILQFAVGFPLTGCLRQSRAFPTDTQAPFDHVGTSTLFASSPGRFKIRDPRAISRHADQLWGEALKQVQEGWLTPPDPLNHNGHFLEHPREECNIAFRLGVEQTDKLRGCDDLKGSLTNTDCTIRTPIALPGWDHIASDTRILADRRCSWSFGKVDHKAAYKALPIRPDDSRYAVIALWGPKRLIWCGCRTRAQFMWFYGRCTPLQRSFEDNCIATLQAPRYPDAGVL